MAEYPINKGIGRPEKIGLKGLEGPVPLHLLREVCWLSSSCSSSLYMVGIDQWICIGFGAASSSLLVWQTFALNARYGEHGLMKLGAARSHPRYLINRRRITRLFKRQRKEERQ